MASQNKEGDDVMVLTSVYFPLLSEDEDAEEWGTFDPALIGDASSASSEESKQLIFPIEQNDDIVLADSRRWVNAVIGDFGVCPFTMNSERAGVPMGGVRYAISRTTNIDEAFYRYWQEIHTLLAANERDIATTLLIFPEIELFGDFELFEAYCECLSDSLCSSAMGFENEIQLVFFHPKYQFRDGQARSGNDQGAANFARRAPWPMINLLRTRQVRNAQKGVPTGIVYKQNEERLNAVGAEVLGKMLFQRNWAGLPVHSSAKLWKKVQEATGISLEDPANPASSPSAPTEGKCPVPHQTVDSSLTDTALSLCPANHHSDESQGLDSGLPGGVEHLGDAEDYAKLADDIEKWLINRLRTKQVRNAQKESPAGIVYEESEERLNAVGGEVLGKELEGKCPVSHQTTTTTSAGSSILGTDQNVCPADHQSDERQDVDSALPVSAESLRDVEDYLKLADDIEKWLQQSE